MKLKAARLLVNLFKNDGNQRGSMFADITEREKSGLAEKKVKRNMNAAASSPFKKQQQTH